MIAISPIRPKPILLLLCLLSYCACQPSDERKNKAPRGEVLALVGQESITKSEFLKALQQLSPFTRRQYTTHKRKAEFLEHLIQFELLIQEAKRLQLDRHASVLQTKRKAMVALLIKQIVQSSKVNEISLPALRKFYHRHYRDYHKPERRRVQHILFRVPANAPPAVWLAKRKAISPWLAKLQEADKQPGGFAALARLHSQDTASRQKGGDLGYAARRQQGGPWESGFSNAAFAIKHIGGIVGPIRSSAGYHFIRLAEIVKPLRQSFQSLQHVLRHRLRKHQQDQAYRTFLASLRRKYQVNINQTLLMQVQPHPPLQPKAPKTPKTPSPTPRITAPRITTPRLSPTPRPAATRPTPPGPTQGPPTTRPQAGIAPTPTSSQSVRPIVPHAASQPTTQRQPTTQPQPTTQRQPTIQPRPTSIPIKR